eukprot:TRINITY_DN62214_c0_g1_i1.p1 TRINITY_DN62214_c0_g1~~TRINITY_DN62214_c0_g1_i1.p1  ORF type:complete len:620 (+),score=96.90 TRINITY_DN62214_c0_g1_i1:108-1967(+)
MNQMRLGRGRLDHGRSNKCPGHSRCGGASIGHSMMVPSFLNASTAILLMVRIVAGEGEEEEEVSTSPAAVSTSVMLLGNIGFMMLLFYLVHHHDDDIKRYSWQVISKTISIFCAVLTFQAFHGLAETYLIEGLEKCSLAEWMQSRLFEGSWSVLINFLHLFVWLSLLQLVLAVTSGAIGEHPANGLAGVELNMKSYAVLFSHTTGFAAINAWGSLQQSLFQDNWLHAVAIVPVGLVGLFLMYYGFDVIRWKVSMSDDEIVDEYEKEWDVQTEEAENDVAGLSLSFLTVQALRFAITSHLPNVEGLEPHELAKNHGVFDIVLVFAFGAVFAIVSIVVLREYERTPKEREKWCRLLLIFNNLFTFANAWCFFYASKMSVCSLNFTSEESLIQVVLALFLSAVSFMFIFFLDAIQDNHILGEQADTAVELMIQGLAVLVGFSWEQAFDVAVVVVSASSGNVPPALSRLLMSILLVLVVFPAWRMHILKTEQDLNNEITADGLKEKKMKYLLKQLNILFLDPTCDELLLDYGHLRLKEKRRLTHGIQMSYPPGLKHFTVTSCGIKERDVSHHHRRHHHRCARIEAAEVYESLLDDQDHDHLMSASQLSSGTSALLEKMKTESP